MTKPKFSALKAILTTASAASILLGSTAFGDATTAAMPAHTNVAVEWDHAPGPNEILIFGAPGAINFATGGVAGAVTQFGNLDIANQNGCSINLFDATVYTIATIENTGGAQTVDLAYNGTESLTIANTGNLLSAVDFNNAAGTLTINGGNIAGAITNATNATLNTSADITIGGANITLGTLGTANGKTVTLNGAHTFNIHATTGTGTIATDAANAVLVGNFGNAGARLHAVTLGGDATLGGAGNEAKIVATTFDGAAALVTVAADSSLDIANAVTHNFAINNGIALTLKAGTYAGTIKATNSGNGTLNIDGDVTLNGGAGMVGGKLNKITVTSGTLTAGADIILGGVNPGLAFAGAGTLNLDTKTLTSAGIAVDFAGNAAGTLMLGNGAHVTGAVDNTDGAGGAAVNIAGTITVAGNLDGNAAQWTSTIDGDIGATKAISHINIGSNGNTWGTLVAKGNVNVDNVAFAGENSILNVGGNAAATLNIATGTTGKGTIITGNNAVTFTGKFGDAAAAGDANRLHAVTLGNAATLGDAGNEAKIVATTFGGAALRNVTLANNSTIDATNINNAAFTLANKTLTLSGGALDAASTIDGAAGTLVIDGNVTTNATIGNGGAITAVTVNAGHTFTVNAVAKATTFNILGTLTAGANLTGAVNLGAAGTLDLATHTLTGGVDFAQNAGTVTLGNGAHITGAVDNTNGGNAGNAAGTITVAGNAASTIDGAIGANNALTAINIGAGATLTAGNNAKAILVAFTDATSVLAMNAAATLNLAGTTGKGTITTGANNLTFEGVFGAAAAANRLHAVTLGGAATLNGANIFATTFDGNQAVSVAVDSTIDATTIHNNFTVQPGATLAIAGGADDAHAATFDAASTLTGNAGGSVTTTGVVNFGAAAVGGGGLALLTVNGGTLNLGADFAVTTTKFGANAGTLNLGAQKLTGAVDFAGNDGVVVVDNGGKITGAVTAGVAGFGTLTLKGGNLAGNVGVNGANLATVNFAETNPAASNGHNIFANTVNVVGNTFTLTANDALTGAVVIANGAEFIANSGAITGDISGANGKLTLGVAPAAATFTGTTNTAVGTIDFTAAGNIDKVYRANTALINDDITIAANGTLNATTAVNIANGHSLTVNDVGTLTTPLVYGAGDFITHKAGAVPTLGNLANGLHSATLGDGANAAAFTATGNHYATAITVASHATLDVSGVGGFTNNGALTFADNSVVNLGSQPLTLVGAHDVTVGANLTINTKIDAGNIGHIAVAGGQHVNVGGKTLTIHVDGAVGALNTQYTLFSAVDGAPAAVNVDHTTIGNTFDYDNVTGKLTVTGVAAAPVVPAPAPAAANTTGGSAVATPTPTPTPVLILAPEVMQTALLDSAKASNKEMPAQTLQFISKAETQAGNAEELVQEISHLITSGESSAATEVLTRVTQNTAIAASHVASSTISEAVGIISSALTSGLTGGFGVSSSPMIGVSSGDEDETGRHGVWVKGFGGQATQKLKSGNPGYKSTTAGGIVGVDSLVSDDLRLGIAGIYADGNIKMKDQKAGDKIRAKSTMLSVYGSYEIDQNWYTRAIATFGSTKVVSKEKNGTGTVTGKYTSTSYNLDLGVGYRHMFSNDVMLTPEVGMRATSYNDGSYTETGGTYNRDFAKKSGNSATAIFGATLSKTTDFAGKEFTPSISAKVLQNLGGKNPEISAKLQGQDGAFVSKSKPVNKTMYNMGVDATVKSGMMEFGAGYDLNFAPKYVAHNGSLKVKVNF